METLGKTGCYFLSIIHLAENVTKERIDAIEQFLIALNAGDVKQDCFVERPEAVMKQATGIPWGMKKVTFDYQPGPNELEILRYERQGTGELIGHFVVGDGNGKVAYDPYGDSRTVRDGTLVSKRVFYRS